MHIPVGSSLEGVTVDNRYKIVQRLAHGGMATVYRAIDTRLDRTVALKILRPNMAEDPSVIDKFEAEAKNTAKINHAHVINVYDQGLGQLGEGHVVYLAMEFVEGHTLRDVMRAAGPMAVNDTWKIALPIIRGVAAAHNIGLIHRDIKPENVLVSHDGDIKVADFGLARAASNHTGTGMALMGTVSYMSPELISGKQADERSDVYALGILLFEMLTGRRPFSGESAVSIAVQHTNSRVPAPSTMVRDISPAVDDLVQHMTEPLPDDRPANASEVVILVQHLLNHPDTAEQLASEPTHEISTPRSYDDTQVYASHSPDENAGSSVATPDEEPRVTILPQAVTADFPDPSTMVNTPGVSGQPISVVHSHPHDKHHVPIPEPLAPIKITTALVKTVLVFMAAAIAVLAGHWAALTFMNWLFS